MILRIKIILSKVLNHQYIGRLLSFIFNDKIPMGKYKFDLSDSLISNTTKASIFWRTYESAEIRFVKKYLSGERDVIEVGASLGVVSAFIIDKIKMGFSFYTVEANPLLINIIERNIININPTIKRKIFNKCINYKSKTAFFKIESDNLVSKINENIGLAIETITIEKIIEEEKIRSFDLVCDIEGAEIDLIANINIESLKKCRTVIIELHDTYYENTWYNQDQILEIWKNKGFSLIDNYGSVYVLLNCDNGE